MGQMGPMCKLVTFYIKSDLYAVFFHRKNAVWSLPTDLLSLLTFPRFVGGQKWPTPQHFLFQHFSVSLFKFHIPYKQTWPCDEFCLSFQ